MKLLGMIRSLLFECRRSLASSLHACMNGLRWRQSRMREGVCPKICRVLSTGMHTLYPVRDPVLLHSMKTNKKRLGVPSSS